jgi:hypothetical protein
MMNAPYAIHELQQLIWEDSMDHLAECTCSLCITLDVINEYVGGPA